MANLGILIKGAKLTTGPDEATINITTKEFTVTYDGELKVNLQFTLNNSSIIDRDSLTIEPAANDIFIPFESGTNKLGRIAHNEVTFDVITKANPAEAKGLGMGKFILHFLGGKVGPGAGF